ncbi:hypothetical protein ACQY0O_003829 [Thecaphora frezii]
MDGWTQGIPQCDDDDNEDRGNAGGIVSGQIFRSKDAPDYMLSYAVSLGLTLAVLCAVFAIYLGGMNAAMANAAALQEAAAGKRRKRVR